MLCIWYKHNYGISIKLITHIFHVKLAMQLIEEYSAKNVYQLQSYLGYCPSK